MEEALAGPADISIIGKAVQALEECLEIQSNPGAIKARILHNSKLVSMAGISSLPQLLDLNLSCNSVAAIEGLHVMRNLRVLNLSNNKIKVINGLSGLYSLERLDLSFNKVTSLMNMSQLYGPQYPFFRSFDIRGNGISQLREVNYLAGCQFLVEVTMQGQTGSNPVCKMMEYQYAVVTAVPSLQYLDRKPVQMLNLKPGPQSQSREPPVHREPQPPVYRETQPQVYREPQVHREPPPVYNEPAAIARPVSPKKADPSTKVDKSVQQLPPPNIQREFQGELIRLQREYEQLFEENKDLLLKYDQNDKYWMERCQRLDFELRERTEEVGELQRQVTKLTKTLSATESKLDLTTAELAKASTIRDTRDKAIDDLHSQIAQMMRDLGEAQKTAQNAVEDSYRYRDKMEMMEKASGELRAQLRQAEQTVGQLHAKTVESSSTALQRLDEAQRRWESAEHRSDQLETENTMLKSRIKELLELNDRLEQVWAAKVKEAENARDNTLATMKLEIAQIASQERERAQTTILQEKEKFLLSQKDFDDEWRKRFSAEQEKTRDLLHAIQNIEREKTDLQVMLKMSVEKETRGKGLIEELTELVKQMQESIDNERKESVRIKAKAEDEITKAQKAADSLLLDNEKLSKRLTVIQSQVSEDETALSEKSREVVKLKRELQELRNHAEELEELHRRAKAKWDKADFSYAEDLSALQQKVTELEDKVATQNVIIDDQNETVKRLKGRAQDAEDQLEMFRGQREQGKVSLETKLADAYDENERLQKKLQDAENYIQKLEEDVDELTTKRSADKDTIKTLNAELMDKASAIELIEREVLALQDARRGEEAEAIAEKNHIIEDLKKYRDELMAAIASKDREIKEKTATVRNLQSHLDAAESDLRQTKAKEDEMQKEIRVLLLELDRQKHQKAEVTRTVTELLNGLGP